MPNRILKESICVSESINSLGWFEEVLFYRLIVNCDDYGRYDGRPLIIKNKLFPLKDNLTAKNVTEAINKLARLGLVNLYEVDGKPFLYLPTWNHHQSIRAKRSKFPDPVENESNGNNLQANDFRCDQMQEDVPVIHSYSESESYSESYSYSGENERKRTTRFTPPTLEEVTAYCQERHNNINPQKFIDYYTSKGWLVGKSKMKDWKAAVRTWEQNSSPRKQTNDFDYMADWLSKEG